MKLQDKLKELPTVSLLLIVDELENETIPENAFVRKFAKENIGDNYTLVNLIGLGLSIAIELKTRILNKTLGL